MKFDSKQLKEMSGAVKAGALYALRHGHSGHVGIVLGTADIITSIYANYLQRGRDDFVLSAGHGSALLYSVLKLSGYKIPSLKTFRKFGGLPGHPENDIDGVAATTGPLGQGVANAVGMAMAKKIKKARGIKNADGHVYCLCSDGDLMEGVAQEAVGFAGRYKLNNLVLLWDDNQISIDGTALTDINVPERMYAAGFEVCRVNGNNPDDIDKALTFAQKSSKPVFVQCKTIIGEDSSVAGTPRAHAYGLDDDELMRLEQRFSTDVGLKLWQQIAQKYVADPGTNNHPITDEYAIENYERVSPISTRSLSGVLIEKLLKHEPLLIGGSADLAGSTNTKTQSHRDITSRDYSGNFINYGVREHAMAAIMNGLCISGFRPYGGTFLVFSDYMRPAIRLSALSKLPVIYVFTHDSIGVGEDGPTHQPIEQLASLRLIPNLNVFRPCNADEVATCWKMALAETTRPSAIALSRQEFDQIPTPDIEEIRRGAYIIRKANGKRVNVTIIATGSEVPLAVAVAKKLHSAQVVSMPSVEKFRQESKEYKKKILQGYVVAIEAGASASWFEFADAVVGVDSFGETGAWADVYAHFGFDADKIADQIKNHRK